MPQPNDKWWTFKKNPNLNKQNSKNTFWKQLGKMEHWLSDAEKLFKYIKYDNGIIRLQSKSLSFGDTDGIVYG